MIEESKNCCDAMKQHFKGNAQLVKQMTIQPLMDFKQNHYEGWKY